MNSEILNTHIFDNSRELSHQIGLLIEKLCNKKGKITIALSGGTTPSMIFNYLSINFDQKIKWSKIQFFWVDERCVPPDHPESNFKMTFEKLLQPLGIEEEQIFRIIGENDPYQEANRYSQSINSAVNFRNNLPSFDLVLLGIGEDGHTASIFPDQMELLGSDKICAVAIHPDTGQQRITLTGKILNNAENIVFLVTGVSKRHILRDILKNQGDWMNFPAACIQPTNGKLQWFIDKKAAGLIY